jgi:hypothetical protein
MWRELGAQPSPVVRTTQRDGRAAPLLEKTANTARPKGAAAFAVFQRYRFSPSPSDGSEAHQRSADIFSACALASSGDRGDRRNHLETRHMLRPHGRSD